MVQKATWSRCRVHFLRDALVYANKTQRRMFSATTGTTVAQVSA